MVATRDRNTKFFHRIANVHRRSNTIDKLKVGDTVVEYPKEVRKEIVTYYEKLYTKT